MINVFNADGRVLGEYGASSTAVLGETIWLSPRLAANDNLFGGDDGVAGYAPLAVGTGSGTGAALTWIHGNHRGVPLVFSNASGTAVTAPNYTLPGFPGQLKTLSDIYYNRYRDYDSSTGRYIQADPIGLGGGANDYGYVYNNPLAYVDPFGLREGSLSNIKKRKTIYKLAMSYNGSAKWCFDCIKDDFPAGSNKCNKFVYDVTNEAGARALYRNRPPLAGDWASIHADILNWRVLEKGERVYPGDVAAYAMPGNQTYTGHTGIITADGNRSAHHDSVYNVTGQFSDPNKTTYHRYTGD